MVRSYARGAMSIVDLRDEVASYLGSPLDALHFYLPRALMNAVTEAAGLPRVSGIACPPGLVDPVMKSLGAAVLCLLEAPRRESSAMSEHLAIAICAHLVHRFGGRSARFRR